MIKLTLVCCALVFGGLSVADNVPTLIWGSFDHYTPAVALKSYNADEFTDILAEHAGSETTTIVVAENHLSPEDLSQCRTSIGNTCFRGIQQVKSKLYLTSVEDPVTVIENLAGPDKIEVSLSPNGALSEPLNPEGGKFVFINFDDDDAASDESKASRLSRHDQLIAQLYADLSAQKIDVMIIYTGKRAPHQRRARQAVTQASSTSSTTSATTAAAPTSATTAASTQPKQINEGVFWKRDRLLIYYLGLETIAQADQTATVITVDSVTLNEATAGRIVVSMVAGSNTFAFNITGDNGYWWLDGFTWNDQALLTSTRIAALETFSFHCSPAIDIGTFNRDILIRWTGLQIQPEFGTVADQTFDSFGDSWDCVGFVSPGIVAGLFVVIMLLFILAIGISWMMDINTMDRFDDPKGKTITISVNE